MTTYFTSDFHIGHGFVAKLRGFDKIEEHDALITKAFQDVYPDDIVWVLGDICVSASGWVKALELLSKLRGRKRLVAGNHDPVSSIHRDGWKFQRQALDVFESVHDFAKIRLNGKTTLLSHYPYAGTGSEGLRNEDGSQAQERYTEFRLTDRGTPLVHGHTHGTERLHVSDGGTLQVHVGMDAWGMKLVPSVAVERLLTPSGAFAILSSAPNEDGSLT